MLSLERKASQRAKSREKRKKEGSPKRDSSGKFKKKDV